MIFKADAIATMLATDNDDPLVVTPTPDLNELRTSGAASIDMRLGTWFLSLRQAKLTHHGIAKKGETQASESKLTKMVYVPFGDEFILHPRCFVLGVTLEWIRMPYNIAGYVVGKSSLGRRGLIIATATGFHPGFSGTLTLELSNVGEIPIKIYPGMRICQLFMHSVDAKADSVDSSNYIGFRKPTLGSVHLDEFAEKLAHSRSNGY